MKSSPEKLARDRTYREEHKEEARAYRESHREVMYAQQKEYRASHTRDNRSRNAGHYLSHRAELLAAGSRFTEWLQCLRSVSGCEDCNTREGRLVHHHLDPTMKRYQVSDMAFNSKDALEEELGKCTVLCGSCHMKRHVGMRALAA